MTKTTQTFLTAYQGSRLASAITHLANGIAGDPKWERHADAARYLVRNLAFPDHVEKPSPASEPSCDAPHCDCVEGGDCRANVAGGTYEDGEGRIRQLSETQPPAGEDCKASGAANADRDTIARAVRDVMAVNEGKIGQAKRNPNLDGWFVGKVMLALEGKADYGEVAAAVKANLARAETSDAVAESFINPRAASSREVRTAVMALQKALNVGQDGIVGPATMRAIGEIRTASSFDVRPGAVNVLPPGMRIDTKGLHPDLAARLDGLKASVDALAERLDRKAGKRRENVRYVYPTSILTVSGQGLVWVISTRVAAHACGFEVGDRVARGDVTSDTMIVTGIASHGNGPLIGLTVRKAEG